MNWEENIEQYPKLKEAWYKTLNEFGRVWLGGQIDMFAETKAKKCIIADVMPSFFKERRLKLKLSMQDVTDQTGIGKATISRIERGNDAFYKTIVALNDFYTKNGA